MQQSGFLHETVFPCYKFFTVLFYQLSSTLRGIYFLNRSQGFVSALTEYARIKTQKLHHCQKKQHTCHESHFHTMKESKAYKSGLWQSAVCTSQSFKPECRMFGEFDPREINQATKSSYFLTQLSKLKN